MFGSQPRPADRSGAPLPNGPVKDAPKMADLAYKPLPLKPTACLEIDGTIAYGRYIASTR